MATTLYGIFSSAEKTCAEVGISKFKIKKQIGGGKMAICAGTCGVLGLTGCIAGCAFGAGVTSIAAAGSVAAALAGGAVGAGGR